MITYEVQTYDSKLLQESNLTARLLHRVQHHVIHPILTLLPSEWRTSQPCGGYRHKLRSTSTTMLSTTSPMVIKNC